MEDPHLSVCLISYNHAPFIRHALDSIATQKVNFSMELIIADDCSRDGTSEIIKDFISTYPGQVNYLKREKNVGAFNNFIDMLAAAKGKYVAYLEGDDYWINPMKLQMQVDFLDKNTGVSLSCHNTHHLKEGYPPYLFNNEKRFTNAPHDTVYTVKDLIIRNFFHSSSIIYRKAALPPFPDWYAKTFAGDYFICLLLATNGDIHFINDVLSVYRSHDVSISAYSSRHDIYINFDEHLKKFNEYSGHKYHKEIANRRFSLKHGFYYYYPNYLRKLWFGITNLGRIISIPSTVISRSSRWKIFFPTFLLKSKVNLFSKKQKS